MTRQEILNVSEAKMLNNHINYLKLWQFTPFLCIHTLCVCVCEHVSITRQEILNVSEAKMLNNQINYLMLWQFTPFLRIHTFCVCVCVCVYVSMCTTFPFPVQINTPRRQLLVYQQHEINPLAPNNVYISPISQLISSRCILNIYSTKILTAYFKHAAHSPFFSLQNAVYFIMLSFLVPVIFTF